MREILFRGQTRRKGQKVRLDGTPVESNWVEGYGVCMGKGDFSVIYSGDHVEKYAVYTDTVGQFTGLYDSTKWEDLSEEERAAFVRDGNLPSEWKGKKIFEGDIVHAHDRLLKGCGPFHEFEGVIGYRDGSFVIEGDLITHYRWMIDYDVTVLGNIHDNPELMEVE